MKSKGPRPAKRSEKGFKNKVQGALDMRAKDNRALRNIRLIILLGMASEPATTTQQIELREQLTKSIYREDPQLQAIMQLYQEA